MPGVMTGDQVVREDISDMYLQSDVRETPVTSRVKKGEKLKNVSIFSWTIQQMDSRSVDGIPEGVDADGFEGNKQFKLYNRSQKFWRKPMVTTEANEINVAPADFGKYVKEVNIKTKEQQRDVEVRYLDDQDSQEDTGVMGGGRRFKGMGMVINDTTSVGSSGAALTFSDAPTAIDPQFRTPSKQIYVGNLVDTSTPSQAKFFEEQLLDMLQGRYDNLGQTTELTMYADSILKRHMSRFFGKYKANVQGYTTIVRTPQEAIDAKEYALYGADVYQTDFGPIMVELMQWAPKAADGTPTGRGYIFNMGALQLRPSGKWMTHRELEDRGAGPRGLIESILGHQYDDPRTHCKIDPVAIAG